MRHAIVAVLLCALLPAAALAQDITIPPAVERLAARAADTVDVTIDGALLRLAAKFLSSRDHDQAAVKQILSKIKGIYVRSFEFNTVGAYSDSDLESMRSSFKTPAWARMASVRSSRQSENVDVYLKMDNDQIGGIVVLATEPRRLTFVNIVGPIDLEQLASLGGEFGIPKLNLYRQK
jgi:hypothetical protein